MDVVDVLRRASDAVERAGVAADLRPAAFSTAVDLLLKAAGADGAPGPSTTTAASPVVTAPLSAAPPVRVSPEHRVTPEHRGGVRTDGHRDPRPRTPWDEPGLRLPEGHVVEHGRGGDHDAYDPYDAYDVREDHRWDARSERGDEPDDGRPAATVSRLGAHAGVHSGAHRSTAGLRATSRFGDARLVAVGPTRGPAAVPDDPWGHIADALGVRPELLDRVWEERGGRLQLAGDPSRLGRTRAQRVGTAAVLLLAALRWSGRDGGEPVPDAVVRSEIERLGLLDTGNYTKHLAGRRQLLSTTGSGRTATYKLRYDGLEEARAIAQALLEDG